MTTQIEFYDKDAIKNILAVLTIRPEKVVYFYDKEIRDMNFFKSLETCFRKHLPNIILEKYPVDINSIDDIYTKTVAVIKENENCIMELTGGSELMMIGGYKAGSEMGIEMVFTDIIKGMVVSLTGGKSRRAARLSLADFIDAKGANLIGNSHVAPKPDSFERIIKMSRYIFFNLKDWKATCSFIQTAMANTEPGDLELKCKYIIRQRDGKKVTPEKSILKAFQKYGFINNLKINEDGIRFLFRDKASKQYMINYGVWLELYVYISAVKEEKFDDVLLGAMIDWDAHDGVAMQGNEIDVIVSHNSMPVFISCKLRDASVAALNELLIEKKRIGGWFSKGILVAFGDDKVDRTGTYLKARELGIILLDRTDIISEDFGKRLANAIEEHDLISMKWSKL